MIVAYSSDKKLIPHTPMLMIKEYYGGRLSDDLTVSGVCGKI